jgi:glutathione S-transferase
VTLADGGTLRATRGVVVATGGFPWSESLRSELYPQPTGPWSMSPQGNRGEGIALSRQAGAAMGTGHSDAAFWAPVSLLQRPDGSTVRYPHLVWDRAKPGLMAVNGAGQRFVNESTSYHEFVRGMYRSHATGVPTFPAFLVADADFVERWGLGLALPGGRPREHLVQAGYLVKAASLAELAAALKIDATNLQAAAEQFNRAAEQGVDTAFGKGSTAYNRYLGDADHQPNPCLGPLRRAPFYAVRVYAGDIGTACGIATDEHARALDARSAHRRPVRGGQRHAVGDGWPIPRARHHAGARAYIRLAGRAPRGRSQPRLRNHTMKLFFSVTSPYVRKCLVVAHELGVSDRITLLPSNAHPVNRDATIIAANPLGKVPTFFTDDGTPLYDSRVICEWLDATHGGTLFPRDGAARWQALVLQSLADGVLDAALLARYEGFVRPEALRWPEWLGGQMDKVHTSLHLAGTGAAAAAGPCRHRHAVAGLRTGLPGPALRRLGLARRYPQLAAWAADFMRRPSLQASWSL